MTLTFGIYIPGQLRTLLNLVTYFCWCQPIPIMHLTTVVLAIEDPEWDLRKEIRHGEEIPEDAVVVGQPLYMKRTAALLPGLMHSIQGDLNWWGIGERLLSQISI